MGFSYFLVRLGIIADNFIEQSVSRGTDCQFWLEIEVHVLKGNKGLVRGNVEGPRFLALIPC